MTLPAPKTPAVAIARVLRGLGLRQGAGQDFRVTGYYRNGERQHTYVLLLSGAARQVVAENADRIEAEAEEGPFPFTVSVRYSTAGHPHPSVRNGGTRVRETPPAAPAAEAPAPAAPIPAPAPVNTLASHAPELTHMTAVSVVRVAGGRAVDLLAYETVTDPRLVDDVCQRLRKDHAAGRTDVRLDVETVPRFTY
ncbi:hypothetical protein [Streptomyces sp. G1]|uniref:hypothetical protein n=1 Tax=Streptomyces sp. G1 TaxID=361572 RepID=UPI00202E530E|nr:hypothetical protein [Streptomyces sp. G1]MCM1964869.1 hypothetical protein [Streptomyces sp. G1]